MQFDGQDGDHHESIPKFEERLSNAQLPRTPNPWKLDKK